MTHFITPLRIHRNRLSTRSSVSWLRGACSRPNTLAQVAWQGTRSVIMVLHAGCTPTLPVLFGAMQVRMDRVAPVTGTLPR